MEQGKKKIQYQSLAPSHISCVNQSTLNVWEKFSIQTCINSHMLGIDDSNHLVSIG